MNDPPSTSQQKFPLCSRPHLQPSLILTPNSQYNIFPILINKTELFPIKLLFLLPFLLSVSPFLTQPSKSSDMHIRPRASPRFFRRLNLLGKLSIGSSCAPESSQKPNPGLILCHSCSLPNHNVLTSIKQGVSQAPIVAFVYGVHDSCNSCVKTAFPTRFHL